MYTVGVDLGGTNVHAVAMAADEVVGSAKLATPAGGPDEIVDTLLAAVDAGLEHAGVDRSQLGAVGVGAPGVVTGGVVSDATNVAGLEEPFALADRLRDHLDVAVRLVNDATAAAVGEHRLGAARGVPDLLAVWVGTGVGAGLVLGGRPLEGAHGAAGEIGHLPVRQEGRVCPCGRRGCVEAYAGRRAMTLAAERALADGDETILFDVMAEKGKPRPTSSVFRTALTRGDRLVAALVDDAVDALGAGIAIAVDLIDVEVVVLGGGLADRLGESFRTRVEAAMQPRLFLQPARVRIIPAALGDDSGAVGAALLARDNGRR